MRQLAELEREAERAAAGGDAALAVSVIVPVRERPEDLAGLYEEYAAPLRKSGRRFEFVFVAEPWYRRLLAPLKELAAAGEPVRTLEVGQGVGEAVLLQLAAGRCAGGIIVTLPSYRRVMPEAMPELVQKVEAGADLVSARRWPRKDSWINRLQTRAFHAIIGRFSSARVRDVACGVRAMRREVLEDLPLYGDFFRFLPLIAAREGYRVQEVDAPQHPADRKARVYSPGVYLRRLVDILGLFFLLRFTEKPLRFFGLVGGTLSLAGGAILVVLLVQRLGGQGIANRPLLLLGVLLLVLGVQAVALGLIGEIIVHLQAPKRLPYRLLEDAGDDETVESP